MLVLTFPSFFSSPLQPWVAVWRKGAILYQELPSAWTQPIKILPCHPWASYSPAGTQETKQPVSNYSPVFAIQQPTGLLLSNYSGEKTAAAKSSH